MEEAIRAALEEEAQHCYRWSSGPAAAYEVHSHPFRKILYVVEGAITFTPQGKEPVAMKPGDRLELPPGTRHGAQVGPEGVTCWEGRARER